MILIIITTITRSIILKIFAIILKSESVINTLSINNYRYWNIQILIYLYIIRLKENEYKKINYDLF